MAGGPPRDLLELLNGCDEPVREMAFALRAVIVSELAPCHEFAYEMRSKTVLIYSASTRTLADGICQMAVFRQHVTLVFPQGIDLDDPTGALRGAGRVMRHIRIETAADVRRQEIRAWLRQARWLAGMKPPRAGGRRSVVTMIKRQTEKRSPARRSRTPWPDRFF